MVYISLLSPSIEDGDKLEKVVNKVAREEGFNAPKLMQHVTLLLLYAYDVVLLSYGVDSMQHLLGVLTNFALVVD